MITARRAGAARGLNGVVPMVSALGLLARWCAT
jgi:hypothetical protein